MVMKNLAAAKQQANNRLDQLDHLNNAQKQQLQSQITQSSDIAAVNGHEQTAESLNTAMGNLINAIADHQAVEQQLVTSSMLILINKLLIIQR